MPSTEGTAIIGRTAPRLTYTQAADESTSESTSPEVPAATGAARPSAGSARERWPSPRRCRTCRQAPRWPEDRQPERRAVHLPLDVAPARAVDEHAVHVQRGRQPVGLRDAREFGFLGLQHERDDGEHDHAERDLAPRPACARPITAPTIELADATSAAAAPGAGSPARCAAAPGRRERARQRQQASAADEIEMEGKEAADQRHEQRSAADARGDGATTPMTKQVTNSASGQNHRHAMPRRQPSPPAQAPAASAHNSAAACQDDSSASRGRAWTSDSLHALDRHRAADLARGAADGRSSGYSSFRRALTAGLSCTLAMTGRQSDWVGNARM